MKLLKTITDDDISGVKFRKLDEYQKEVDNFVGEMARIVRKLEER